MKRSIALLALACASLPLAACAEDGYRVGLGMAWHSYPYDVWYDGYYGPIYDGYWGTNGFFYFRLSDADRYYRKGSREHFRRDQRYQRYDGHSRQPPDGTRVPNYPKQPPPRPHEE